MNIKNRIPLTENYTFQLAQDPVLLTEGDNKGQYKAVGQFGKADVPTANGRVYPRKLWERELKSLNPRMARNEIYGELDHPGDGMTKLQRASHLISKAELLPDGRIVGEAIVLGDTRNGKQLLAILRGGGRIGVSSRGFGSVQQNEQGHDVVQDDFQLLTWDFVADPAANGSYPEFENVESNQGNSVKIEINESSNNEAYGFFGTLRSNYDMKRSEAAKVFDYFEKKFLKSKELSGHPDMARDYLDSRYGRMFADSAEKFLKSLDEPSVKDVIVALEKSLKKYKAKGLGIMKFQGAYDPIGENEELKIKKGKLVREENICEEGFKPNDLETNDSDEQEVEKEKDVTEEPADSSDTEEEETTDKMESLILKIRKEETEKAVSRLSEMIDGMKENIREEIRGELESDPKIAGAKLAIENVKKELRPYIIGEDISEEINQRDSKIESLQQEVTVQGGQLEQYKAITKELGYKLRIEQRISDFSSKKDIRTRMGDVTRFESLKQLDKKLDEILTAVKEQEERFVRRDRVKEEKVVELEKRVKELDSAYQKALSVAERFGIQAYMEKRLAGHPAAVKIKKIAESRGLNQPEEIDALVEQFNSLKTPGKAMISKIRSKFKTSASESLVEDQVKVTVPRKIKSEIVPGVSYEDIERLS